MNEVLTDLYLGMISGTSRDGADAALVDFTGNKPCLIKTDCRPYPPEIAQPLDELVKLARKPTARQSVELDRLLAGHFAVTAQALISSAGLQAEQVTAIGSHGQTVWHAPDSPQPETIQLGNPQRIADLTGITTVGDFRRADLAAGGQGAPLAPLLHRALFRPDAGTCIVLNLGGIANVSILDASGDVSGYDTGPANCLLDAWIRSQRGDSYDHAGAWAASGRVDADLLQRLAQDPYFSRPPPKSTGIEHFNLDWLKSGLAGKTLRPEDVQATLAELTATTVAEVIRPHRPNDVLVCGGGVHNAHLLARLESALPGARISSTAEFGLGPDSIEAMLFAWLARERLSGRKMDTRCITGATRPVLLGTVCSPRV